MNDLFLLIFSLTFKIEVFAKWCKQNHSVFLSLESSGEDDEGNNMIMQLSGTSWQACQSLFDID